MSPFLEFITPLKAAIAFAIPLAIMGVHLSRRRFAGKLVAWPHIASGARYAVIAGCWILFANLGNDAHERGMISLTTFIVSEVLLFAIVAGGFHLVERRYPEQAAKG